MFKKNKSKDSSYNNSHSASTAASLSSFEISDGNSNNSVVSLFLETTNPLGIDDSKSQFNCLNVLIYNLTVCLIKMNY